MLIYMVIVAAKIVEVALMTIRTVMLTKGERLYAAMIGFVEIVIWLYLMATILGNMQEDPYRLLAYAVGFTIGLYFGSWLEEVIGVGLITIHAISDVRAGMLISSELRRRNMAVTHLKGEGRDAGRSVLIINIKRRRKKEAIKAIKNICPTAFISTYDVRNIAGGYGLKK